MKSLIYILLLSFLFLTPLGVVANAEMDLKGATKITMLKNDHLLVQKGIYRRDGNHTCDSVDLYKIEKNDNVFVETLTCEEAEKYYKKYKGKDYIRPEEK